MTGKVPKQNRINKKSDPYFRSYLIYLPSETLYFEITPHLTTRVITIPRTGRGRCNRGVGDMSPPTLKSRGPPMYWSPPVTTTFMLIGWSPPLHTHHRSNAPTYRGGHLIPLLFNICLHNFYNTVNEAIVQYV